MLEFFAITTSLPAVPFAAALVLVVAYWMIALVSGLDLGADGAADAAAEAATEGLAEAAADAAVEAATNLDVAADAAESVVDDAIGSPEGAGPPALFTKLTGLGQVPITVWFSLFALWGWLLAFGLSWTLRHPLAGVVPATVGSLGSLAAATVGATVLTGRTARPLAPLFRVAETRHRSALAGEVAEITTGRVDGRFGQARVQIGGDDLVVQVRNDGAENGLARGTKALVVGYDQEREAYVVERLPEG